LAGAGLGRISKKCPDSGLAGIGAKIQYNPPIIKLQQNFVLHNIAVTSKIL